MNKETLFEKYTTVLKPLPTEMRPGGRLRSEIRAILFDIYGTLFISGAGDIGTATARGGISRAMGDLLRQHGIQEDQSAVLKRLDQAITHRHEELGREGVDHPEVEIDKIWAKVLDNEDMAFVRNFAVEYECIVNPVYPMPYLRELVTACANKGITMGIVSNAQFYTPDLFRWFLDADSESLGFRPDLTFYSYEFGHAKPSRKIFQAAADALADIDIPTDSALYLGNDMLNDINRHLSGWARYYSFGYPRKAMRTINRHVRRRLVGHLRRRSQRPFRPPKGRSYYGHLKQLGLIYL